MKSLYDISWKITEEEYRNSSAMNFSSISRYSKEGFSCISKLKEKEDSPAFLFGSAVDCWITEGKNKFDEKYIVMPSNIKTPSSTLEEVIKFIISEQAEPCAELTDVSEDLIIRVCDETHYGIRFKDETKVKNVLEYKEYYKYIVASKGKIVLNNEVYSDVCNTVDALKQMDGFFKEDNPFDNIQRFYQLKFAGNIEGVPFRCMAD